MHARDPHHLRSRHTLPSIPGTGVPRRGLFVSRWGALLTRPARRGLPAFDAALFVPGALDRLFRAQHHSWNLYLVGNEDAVARGGASEEDWNAFETALLAHLAGLGIPVTRNYACLDHPQGRGKHKRDSVFLFPNTGVLYHAAQEDGIALAESWLFSDDVHELAAGWRAGCRIAGVRLAGPAVSGEISVEPQLSARDLTAALAGVLGADEYARH
jgi:histidinol phosphatase-like enzyme